MSENKKEWIAFLDDNGKKITGMFEIVKETDAYIQVKSGTNTIRIPWHRFLKGKDGKK